MGISDVVKTFFSNASKSTQLQAEVREGIANQADVLNQRFRELIEHHTNQSARNEQHHKELLAALANQTNVLDQRLKELIEQQLTAGKGK